MTAPLSRRNLLGASLGLPLLSATAFGQQSPVAASNGKRLLVLGGTHFLGPAIVDEALRRGYEVTLFNRGKSNPALYPGLEKLVGDRDTHDLAALEGRDWDYAIDTSSYLPSHAVAMGEVLADHVGHYVMISTLSVYDGSTKGPLNESAPVGKISAEDEGKVTSIRDVMRVGGGAYYGPLKARCEEEFERAMGGRFTSLRPGVIAGRDDPSDRLPYWVMRAGQGGEVLAPGNPKAAVYFTDARDLGIFSLDFAQQGLAGIYNANGFEGTLTMEEMLHGCKAVMGGDVSFTWVDGAWLLERKVRPFSELPFWLPEAYKSHWDNSKGVAAGMRFRPIAETMRETADWFDETRDETYKWGVYGMQSEREAELLAEWHARATAAKGETQGAGGE